MNDPGNYKGISLLSILSKVYTHIINSRLTWAESNFVLTDAQTGIRKGRSTVDRIFTLHTERDGLQITQSCTLHSLILREPTILLIATFCGRYCSEAVSKVKCCELLKPCMPVLKAMPQRICRAFSLSPFAGSETRLYCQLNSLLFVSKRACEGNLC